MEKGHVVSYMLKRVDHMPVIAYEGTSDEKALHWFLTIKNYSGLLYVHWSMANGGEREYRGGQ
jgi:hypothetical protein